MAEQVASERATVPWWALAVGLAAALKLHFSAAAATDLAWMLRPLTVVLRTAAGWQFLVNAAGEWECPDAGIVLVKACAGINFMVLALLGWCWALRPRGHAPAATLPRLAVALMAAWATALLANAARILAIVRWQPGLERWLEPGDAHRLLGLAVYLPALCLLWLLADRERPGRGLALGLGLYAALMLLLPLLGGAGSGHWARHALWSLAVLVPVGLAGLLALPLLRKFRHDRLHLPGSCPPCVHPDPSCLPPPG